MVDRDDDGRLPGWVEASLFVLPTWGLLWLVYAALVLWCGQ